jgi:hypothetical protein
MNTGVCITCGAQDVDLDDDTEQCENCQSSESGEPKPDGDAADDAE